MLNIEEIKANAKRDISNLEKMEHVGYNSQQYAHEGAALTMRVLLKEVERLAAEVKCLDNEYHHYRRLSEDADQQISTLKKALYDMLFAYQNKDADCPHQFETEAVHQAQQLTHETQGESCQTCQKISGCQHRRFEPNDYEPCAEYEAREQEGKK